MRNLVILKSAAYDVAGEAFVENEAPVLTCLGSRADLGKEMATSSSLEYQASPQPPAREVIKLPSSEQGSKVRKLLTLGHITNS